MRMRAVAAAFAASLFLAGPLLAQDQTGAGENPPPPAPSDEDFTPEHLAAAQEIIDLTKSDRTFDDILPRLALQTQAIFTRANPALTQEIEDTVTEVALSMTKRRAELAHTLQLVWARRFTVGELGELKTFFESPVGKKFVDETPVITALAIGAARQWEQDLSAAMVDETRAKLREKGYAL